MEEIYNLRRIKNYRIVDLNVSVFIGEMLITEA